MLRLAVTRLDPRPRSNIRCRGRLGYIPKMLIFQKKFYALIDNLSPGVDAPWGAGVPFSPAMEGSQSLVTGGAIAGGGYLNAPLIVAQCPKRKLNVPPEG